MKILVIALAVVIVALLAVFVFVPGPRRAVVPAENSPQSSLSDKIVVSDPSSGARIVSPLSFSGKARGMWFFEGSFPVRIIDEAENTIGAGIATADGEWMTEEFVPFRGNVTFVAGASGRGFVVFKKDNPSGMPERDEEVRVPVVFR